MDHAKAPFQRIFLTGFMLWMSGGINIFSLLFTGIAFWQCLQAFLGLNAYFAGFERINQSLLIPKLVYLFVNSLTLALVLYKCHALGLLPTAIDWVSAPIPLFAQHSFGPF